MFSLHTIKIIWTLFVFGNLKISSVQSSAHNHISQHIYWPVWINCNLKQTFQRLKTTYTWEGLPQHIDLSSSEKVGLFICCILSTDTYSCNRRHQTLSVTPRPLQCGPSEKIERAISVVPWFLVSCEGMTSRASPTSHRACHKYTHTHTFSHPFCVSFLAQNTESNYSC